jgi:hypothetical protein
VEALPPLRVFYFHGMQSFHVNRSRRRPAGQPGSRIAPVSITLPVTFTAPY